jgi:molecular chaperone DnaK
MGVIVGIDLGTTFSAVAQLDDTGTPQIVHNKFGDNLTPSVVEFLEDDITSVGEESRQNLCFPNFAGAGRFKREMGTSKTYEINGKTYTPTELSAFVLRKLKEDVEATLGPIDSVVVTIPANFANEARDATMEAAQSVGLNVQHIINEPTAAALFYALDKGGMHGKYAVYDLGGGTFDISIIQVDGFEVEVLGTTGVPRLGGDDFDEALLKVVQNKYKQQTDKELTPEVFSKNDAEKTKITLTGRQNKRLLLNGERIEISRSEFEESISSLVAQTELACEGVVVNELGLSFDDIEGVFLVGGSTRSPIIDACVKKVFGKQPISTANPDEVVAKGAAFYSGYKSPADKLNQLQKQVVDPVNVQERAAMCFGVISLNTDSSPQNSIMITKGEKIPCSKTESFYTVADGQTGVNIRITESRAPETDPTFVSILKEDYLKLPSGRPAGQEIKVTYSFDDSQKQHCEFVDVATGEKTTVIINKTDSKASKPADPTKVFTVE